MGVEIAAFGGFFPLPSVHCLSVLGHRQTFWGQEYYFKVAVAPFVNPNPTFHFLVQSKVGRELSAAHGHLHAELQYCGKSQMVLDIPCEGRPARLRSSRRWTSLRSLLLFPSLPS